MRPKNIPVFVSYKVELYDDLRKAFKDRKGGYFSISTTIPQQIVAVLTGSTAEQSAQLDEIYEVLDQ